MPPRARHQFPKVRPIGTRASTAAEIDKAARELLRLRDAGLVDEAYFQRRTDDVAVRARAMAAEAA